MHYKKATRKDVARLAGVSEPTVSYVINKSRRFSEDIENRVHKAIKALNYEPNAAAKNLALNKSFSLCTIVHDITNPIFTEIMMGFQEAALKEKYIVSVCDAHKDIENHVNNLIARNFDGVFLYVLSNYKQFDFIERFIRSGVKVVLSSKLDNEFITNNSTSVEVDHQGGMKQIVDYLVSLEHKDIIYLSGLDKEQSYDKRYSSFKENYYNHFQKEPMIIDDPADYGTSVHHGKRLTEKLLATGKPFTAIVTTNDLMAYGVIETLNTNNIKVPEDVSVVGIDDLKFSNYTNPKLTTLGFDKKAYGKMIFFNLLNQINNHKLVNQVLETKLVIRDSSSINLSK